MKQVIQTSSLRPGNWKVVVFLFVVLFYESLRQIKSDD